MPTSLEDRRQQYLQQTNVQPVKPPEDSKAMSLEARRNAYLGSQNPVIQEPNPSAGSFIQEFLVDSVSDVGAVLGGIGGAAIGGGLGAVPGAVAGAGLGTMAEQGLRLLLGMTPQEQLVAASQDPVLNDLANTVGFDLLGGLAAKGVTKGVKAGAEKFGRGAAKALSNVDETTIKAAEKLADNGIILDSVTALEGNVPETMSRLAKPDDLEKIRQRIIKSNAEHLQKITGVRAEDATAAKSFQRGEQVINETNKAAEKLGADTTSRDAIEQLDVLKARAAELEDLAKKPTGMAPVQDAAFKKAVKQDIEANAQEILDVSKKVSPGYEELDKALNVDTLKSIAYGKNTPLAKNVIKSIVAHPERIDAALTISPKLKPILREELVTQLTQKSKDSAVDFIKSNKNSFERLLPKRFYKGNDSATSILEAFYQTQAKSTADKIISNYGSAWIGTKGAQTLMWFGRNAVRSGVFSAASAAIGDITGGVLVTLGSKSFVKRVLLNPKYSQIAIKAAQKQPLTAPELKTLMSAIAGTRVVINQIDKQGKKVGQGKEMVLEERTNFVPRQVQR